MDTPSQTIDLPFPLTTHDTLAERALRVPAEMVLQIASGLDDPPAIAARYGYSAEEFKALSEWTPFMQEVAKVRAELEKSGFDFVLDSRLKAKELSNVIFLRAMKDDATFGQVHDAFRTFTEFADLKPKPAPAPGAPGNGSNPGFSISIVFSGKAPPASSHPVIDVTPATDDTPAPFAPSNPFVIAVKSA
jgi:hypothetical protein